MGRPLKKKSHKWKGTSLNRPKPGPSPHEIAVVLARKRDRFMARHRLVKVVEFYRLMDPDMKNARLQSSLGLTRQDIDRVAYMERQAHVWSIVERMMAYARKVPHANINNFKVNVRALKAEQEMWNEAWELFLQMRPKKKE